MERQKQKLNALNTAIYKDNTMFALLEFIFIP